MKIGFKNKDKSSFKAGDIVALKEEYNDGSRTGKLRYYIIGLLDSGFYCLINVKTGQIGEALAVNGSCRHIDVWDITNLVEYYNEENLTDLIEHYDGKIYSGDKAKLILEKNK